MLSLYEQNVSKSQQTDTFEKVRMHWYTKGDWEKFTLMFKTSPFVDHSKFWTFLENLV